MWVYVWQRPGQGLLPVPPRLAGKQANINGPSTLEVIRDYIRQR